MKKTIPLFAFAFGLRLASAAATYGTLDAQTNLVVAPPTVVVDGFYRGTETITEAQANALGYRLVVDTPPVCASNEYAVAVEWKEEGQRLEVIGQTEGKSPLSDLAPLTSNLYPRICRVYEKRTVAPMPRRWTPLAIKRAAAKLGKWQDIKAFLVAADAYDDFCMAQYETEDDVDFVRLMAAARTQLGSAVVNAVLNSAEVEP